MTTLDQKMIDRLKTLAKNTTWGENDDGSLMDDFMIDDYAGGNVDDAFSGGQRAGEIELAREVLKSLNIDWE